MEFLNDLIHIKYNLMIGIGVYLLLTELLLVVCEHILKRPTYEQTTQTAFTKYFIYFSGHVVGLTLLWFNPFEYVGILFIVGLSLTWITDLRSGYILNIVTYPLLILGVISNIADIATGTPWLESNLVGTFLVIFIFTIAFFIRPGAMGFGDIKLFLVISLLLPPTGLFITIFISCIVGMIGGAILLMRKGKSQAFVFGPYIVLAVLLLFVFDLTHYPLFNVLSSF